MYRVTLLILLAVLLVACDAVPTPSLGEVQARLDATSVELAAQRASTEQAARATQDQVALLQAQATLSAAETEQAARVVLEMIKAQATATADAYAAQQVATRTAVAIEVEAQISLARANMEAFAAEATQSAIYDAEKARRAREDFRLAMQNAWDTTLLVGFVVVSLVFLYLTLAYIRSRRVGWSAVYRDHGGAAPLMLVDGRMIDPDLSVSTDVMAPPPDKGTQIEIKHNQQKIQLIRAAATPGGADLLDGGDEPPDYRILMPADAPPKKLLPDKSTGEVVDADWRAADGQSL